MATIHVNRGGTTLGTFSEEDVRAGLRSGRFAGTDLGWREGMASWQMLSQFSEFAADIPSGGPPPPPSAPPPSTITPASAGSTSETPTTRSGLPWEQRQERGFVNAFIETLAMVLTRPSEAFTVMKREGGLAEPLIYALIGGCVGGFASFLFSLGLQSIGLFSERRNAFAVMTGMGVGSVAFIILLPVCIIIGLFIGAAVVHLCLMLVGGAKQSFETTFRVLAFSHGSTGLLQLIPVCGGLIAGVWGLVVNCIGLARAHGTETGRAVLAVFLPLIVCCGAIFLIAMMFGALGVWHGSQH
jgi:hypothetical protein